MLKRDKEYNRNLYQRNKQWYKEYHLKNKEKNNLISSINNFKRRYGITIDDYNKMFYLQEGKCAICNIHQSCFKRALSIDHNHQTGVVRGLLCQRCNVMLGYAKDNVCILQNAANYLNKENIKINEH